MTILDVLFKRKLSRTLVQFYLLKMVVNDVRKNFRFEKYINIFENKCRKLINKHMTRIYSITKKQKLL